MCCRAVSVNLNWRTPASTLASLVRGSGCRFLFASRFYSQLAKEIEEKSLAGLKVVFMEDLVHTPLGEGEEGIELPELRSKTVEDQAGTLRCELQDVCAVFFTSGSTSLPKAGVRLVYCNISLILNKCPC